MAYDLVIRGGDIVDGSGLARFRADVGVKDGRIAKIGQIAERGEQEIDAEGHIVTPGFVDGHTHMDAQINWEPLGASSCYQGVTTVVMGNCGFTLAPSREGQRELVVRNLERAEDISSEAMELGIKWNWESFPEYLDVVERLPKGLNHSVYLGHSALRTWAMGERAFEVEATDDDLTMMADQLRAGLQAGAIGFSTSRSAGHETSDDRPVASRVASWDEVRHLARVMGDLGRGMFELSRDFGTSLEDAEARAPYLKQLEDLALETRVPVTFGVTVAAARSNREAWRDLLNLLERTARGGGRMIGQSHSRDISSLMSFQTALPFDRLPTWKPFRSLPLDQQEHLLRHDPELRARLVHAATHEDYPRTVGPVPMKPEWHRIRVYTGPLPPYPTMAQLQEEQGRDPVEIMLDLALQRPGLGQFFIQKFGEPTDDDLLEIMRHPHTVMTFSDSGAHVSQIADSSIHTHLLAYWVREKQAFTLEEAIRMITSAPATAWGFKDRGLLREGLAADINVINPNTVAPATPQVAHDLPGGARRLVQRATGFRSTIVNGQILMDDGAHTGVLPGKLIRH